MTLTDVKDVATIIGVILTLVAIGWAIFVYRNNSRLERAKWLASLYEKFYEQERLKSVRETIDSDDEKAKLKIDGFIENEPPEFADYLNFFEFVAILEENKQLTIKEVSDLFSYYLNSIYKCEPIRNYIFNEKKGFEKLRALYGKLLEQQK